MPLKYCNLKTFVDFSNESLQRGGDKTFLFTELLGEIRK